jgi:BMFP domain-containing protein YqiC
MAESDPKDNQLVTRRVLKRVLGMVGEEVKAHVADPMKARLEALEKRIAALEQRTTDAR